MARDLRFFGTVFILEAAPGLMFVCGSSAAAGASLEAYPVSAVTGYAFGSAGASMPDGGLCALTSSYAAQLLSAAALALCLASSASAWAK